MRINARGTLVWPAVILAGLALGAFAFVAWPHTTAGTKSHPARVSGSVGTEPGRELASVGGSAQRGDIFVYELPSSMLIDSIMATPQPVDAH